MNFLKLFQSKDLSAEDLCFTNVNYGYTFCDDTSYNQIDECGLTVDQPQYSLANTTIEEYEPICRQLCNDDDNCSFYTVKIDWVGAKCTLKSMETMLAAANTDLDGTIDPMYCNVSTPKANYTFISTCGYTRGCAWETDAAQFGTGAKNCSDWDVLDSCSTPPPTPITTTDTTEEVITEVTLVPATTVPTEEVVTPATLVPATTVPTEEVVTPATLVPATTVPTEEVVTPATLVPATTVPTEEVVTPATLVPATTVPTESSEDEEVTTFSPYVPPRPDGQGTNPPEDDDNTTGASSNTGVVVGSACAGAAGIAGAAAAYMKGGFGGSGSSAMDTVQDVNLDDNPLDREQVAEVDLNMFA